MSLRPGEEWGSETTRSADLDVRGGDADLATAVAGAVAGVLVRFHPDAGSDLARAVGLRAGAAPQGRELPMDALDVAGVGLCVNALVWGVPLQRLQPWHRRRPVQVAVDGAPAAPASATTVVALVGEYVAGFDVSPRGHPGDGVAELQLYALGPGQRRPMVARLGGGTHLPHPQISTRRLRRVSLRSRTPRALEMDGRPIDARQSLDIELVRGRYSLLI